MSMNDISQPEVLEKFKTYPMSVREKLLFLRQMILETASEIEDVDGEEETLRWGEPSYIAKAGSTIRIDWKPDKAAQYAMFFSCQTKLVSTFRSLYPDDFAFEGNRAIIFQMEDNIEIEALKHCIALALRYHKVKDLPSLGA
ncbi:MAG: DUF1801 domain-containing protein [Cyanobacteria bacterium J06588_5]